MPVPQEELPGEPQLPGGHRGARLAGRDRREQLPQHRRPQLRAPQEGNGRPRAQLGTGGGDALSAPRARQLGVRRLPGAPAAGPPLAPRPRRVTSVAFSLTLERVRGLNEPRRHVLREHFLADVVSQLGAPASPLLVSQYLQRAHGRRGRPKRQRSVGAHRGGLSLLQTEDLLLFS